MNKTYTFEHDFLMERFLQEEPQTLDDMISGGFNAWMEGLDVQDVINYAQKYADQIKAETYQELITDLHYCIENKEDYKRVKTYLENRK